MIKRYFTAATGAIAITLSLFLGMNYLVAAKNAEKPEEKIYPPIVIGTISEVADTHEKIKQPERPERPEIITTSLPPTTTKSEKPGNHGGPRILPEPTADKLPRGFGLANGDIQPLRKFAPAYPRTMIARGVEGYVIVKFTVNKMGAVENIVIVESTNAAFNKNSLRAVAKYKYKPRVIDGVAVQVTDVMEKISFKLENSQS